MDWPHLQQDWDAQQQTYMPDREERFAAMLDVVEGVAGDAPRILDLAGGTGSITLRALRRFTSATSVIVDVDPVLLAIAAGTFAGDERVRVVGLDLATSDWRDALGDDARTFDAVLTATALHWLTDDRIAGVYREAGALLRPGGVLANADHMVDEGLPELTTVLIDFREVRRAADQASTGATDWDGWWEQRRNEPELADAIAARDARFGGRGGSAHTESTMSSTGHVRALRAAGFREAGLVWRGLTDAVVVGLR
jgi:SAM-dependent methyltransferase